MRPRRRSKIKRAWDEHVASALEVTETPRPTSVAHDRVAAALAQIPDDTRKILVVHPEIDSLPVIKAEAARMGLTVVLGDAQTIRKGEAYLIKDMSFLKKEWWQ